MSGLTSVLFKSLGLPIPENGHKLQANYNESTQGVDGNTDSNHDGVIDENDRNGWVEPEELYQEVFSNRRQYVEVLQKLRSAGLEDPFEITPEIIKHVENLFKRYKPKTQLEKAFILFLSVVPSDKFFKVEGVYRRGFTEAEGGLEMPYNNASDAPLRKRFGALLPKEIIAASKKERVALCLEYSHLLVILLRAAGIEAHTKGEPGHAYVIALLDGEKYRLDAANLIFGKTWNGANTDRESITMHYLNEGAAFDEQGRLAEAIECYDKALEFKPDSVEAWINKGIVLAKQGRLEEAIECCNRALDHKLDSASAWHNLGLVLIRQGKLVEAKRHFDMALKYEPDFVEAWINKGAVLTKQGKLAEAIECYDKALEFKPDSVEAWNNKGIALAKQGRLEEAIECCNRALDHKLDSASTWHNLGLVLSKQGKLVEAKRHFDMALKYEPDFVNAWINKGNVLAKQGRLEEAIEYYDKALEFRPDNAAAWYNKGITLKELGKQKEAEECFSRASRLRKKNK